MKTNRTLWVLGPLAAALMLMTSIGCSRFSSMTSLQPENLGIANCSVAAYAVKLASYSPQDACEDAANYVCESQTFSYDSPSENSVLEDCAVVSGLGYVCLNVDAAVSNSSSNVPERTVFHCSNTEVSNPGSFLFQASADSFAQALDLVVAKCRTGSL